MASGVLGAISDNDAVRNPLGGLSTGIGVGYGSKAKAASQATLGLLHRIGRPPVEQLRAINPDTLTNVDDIDLQFWTATAPVVNGATFPDNPALKNRTGQTVQTGEACWALGALGSVVAFDFLSGSLAPIAGVTPLTFTRAGATATRVNASGLIEVVAADAPRFDYNPVTKALRGLLIEEARTNLIQRSSEFDIAPWVAASGGTATPNVALAPDGTMSADRLEDDSAAAFEGRTHSFAVPNDAATYTFSFFVKKTSGGTAPTPGCNMNLSVGTSISSTLRINSDTGILYASSTGNSRVEDCGDYWRCAVSLTNNASGNTTLNCSLFPAAAPPGSGNDSAAAVGEAIFWGAQMEAGAFPTSYVPTAGATVARAADTPTIASIAGFWNPLEGSAMVEALVGPAAIGTAPRFVEFNDGTAAERLMILTSDAYAARMFVDDGSVNQANPSMGAWTPGALARLACAWKLNDFYLASNHGLAPLADSVGTLPTVDRAFFGHTIGGGANINGHLRKVSYYPRRLSNADLVALAQP